MLAMLRYGGVILAVAGAALVGAPSAVAAPRPANVTVSGPAEGLPLPTPLLCALPAGAKLDAMAAWELRPVRGPKALRLPAQLTAGPDGGLCVAFCLPSQPAGEERALRLRLVRLAAQPAPAFRLDEADAKHLHLAEGEQRVLTYNFGMLLPEGVPEDRRRSSYVHPLYGLDGEQLSDDFPRDHYHHRGLFWAWPRCKVGDRAFDVWTLGGGGQRFERWLGRETGPVCALFGVENGWYVGDRRVARETAWIRVWPAGDVGRAVDVDLTFAALDGPVEILGAAGKGYGGLGLRFAPRQDTLITIEEGPQTADSNMKRSPWADLSARFADREAFSGAAIFEDSGNPGAPNGWTLRPYGYLGVNWPGLEPYVLQPGQPIRERYRLWLHRGDFAAGQVLAAYEAFAHPPQAQTGG
jgi:hypothetical protein